MAGTVLVTGDAVVNAKGGTAGKGGKAGKAYRVKVKVTAAGGKQYKKATKTVTVTVKVK